MKIRIRFGIRLSWPITNAGTLVGYVKESDYDKVLGAVSTLQTLLAAVPGIDRLFVEKA